MNLRQLGYLVALDEEGTFTAAAARSHVAQPSLSQQIARLEAELGIALVDRTTRRASLTQAGSLLVEHARRAIGEVDAARAELADLVGLRTGRLTIGASQIVGSLDLPRLVARFHHRHPGIDLAVREDFSVELLDALQRDELDLAFVTTAEPALREGIEARIVAEEPLVAIVPPQHRLAARRRLTIEDLRDEPLVGFQRGGAIRRSVTQAAEQAGFAPRVAFETNDVTRIRSLVAEGLGIAILPRSDAELPGPPATVVPLGGGLLAHQVLLAQRVGRHHAPAARAFIELLDE